MENKLLRKGIAHLLSVLMILSTIGAGLTALGFGPMEAYAASLEGIQKGNTVKMGVDNSYYTGTPDWSVLKVIDEDNDGTGDKALVIAKKLWTGDGTSDATAKVKFAASSNAWDGSDAKAWCEGFYSNILLNSSLVASTDINDAASDNYGACTSAGNRVFFLSVEEAQDNLASLIAKDEGGTAGKWWLRSPDKNTTNKVAQVNDSGGILVTYPQINTTAARPAFWLDLSSDFCAAKSGSGVATTWTVNVNNTSHSYGTPSYTWAENYTTCTASATCSQCSKELTETATSTSSVSGNTTTYTAEFENSAFTTQTKEVTNASAAPTVLKVKVVDEAGAAIAGIEPYLSPYDPVEEEYTTNETWDFEATDDDGITSLTVSDPSNSTLGDAWEFYVAETDGHMQFKLEIPTENYQYTAPEIVLTKADDDSYFIASVGGETYSEDTPYVLTVKDLLAEAKASAKTELATYRSGKADADYDEDGVAALDAAKTAGDTAIDAAETVANVTTALQNAKGAIDAVQTKAQKEAAALDGAKTAAKTELATYRNGKNDADYDEEGVAALDAAKTAGDTAIDAAETEAAVATALDDAKGAIDVVQTKAQKDSAEVDAVKAKIDALPAADKVTTADKDKIEAAKKAYDALTADQKKLIDADTVKKLTDAQTALGNAQKAENAAAAEAKAKSVTTITVNVATVNAKAIDNVVNSMGGSEKYVTKIILGSKVKKISSKAFAKYKNVTTVEVKTKKLKKKSVKNSMKNSKVKTVKVKVAKKAKTNKKYIKKYKKFFTKKNAGKKVSVK